MSKKIKRSKVRRYLPPCDLLNPVTIEYTLCFVVYQRTYTDFNHMLEDVVRECYQHPKKVSWYTAEYKILVTGHN